MSLAEANCKDAKSRPEERTCYGTFLRKKIDIFYMVKAIWFISILP